MRKSILFFALLVTTGCFSQKFRISYSNAEFKGPFSGKVFLYLAKNEREPKNAEIGIESFPCFSIDVKNVKPGEAVLIDDRATGYPVRLTEIERGDYYVQAVWDRNLGGRSIGGSPGNIFNKSEKISISKDQDKIFAVNCSEIIPERGFKETALAKELKVPSTLLSTFLNRQVSVNAAVLLPKDYYLDSLQKFPVLFLVFGYGGDYHFLSGDTSSRPSTLDTIPCITVYLDGNCPLGHSVYANSDNNGPWGDALANEFIPTLEKKFRCNGARFLRGHSSGGWTVLWLQTHYPKIFAGCWSSSPDPVDFRDFQKINLYKGENFFYAEDSSLHNVATIAGRIPWASMKQVYQMENVIYRGEQMHSFDAVFSARGTDGNPERICDPVTGQVNAKVFEHWKQYDISFYLRNNWSSLKTGLDGKIRVTVGEQDNFLLNGPVHLLEKEMKAVNADMQFEYFPGDHFTVSTPEYRQKGMKFLADRYAKWQQGNK